jgi:hypothetical protein
MSRISEVATYTSYLLEAALNKCAITDQPVSAYGVAQILEDIRLLKCGLLAREEALPGGSISSEAITQRVMLRLPKMGESL